MAQVGGGEGLGGKRRRCSLTRRDGLILSLVRSGEDDLCHFRHDLKFETVRRRQEYLNTDDYLGYLR